MKRPRVFVYRPGAEVPPSPLRSITTNSNPGSRASSSALH